MSDIGTQERNTWWDEMSAYGQARARELDLSQADVEPAVRAVRRKRRKRPTASPGADHRDAGVMPDPARRGEGNNP